MDKNQAIEPLARRIEELRAGAGISLYELANRSGINRSQLTRLLQGETRQPTPETMNKLAAALNVDPEEFYDLASATGTLPSLPTYFRSKYGLSDKQIASLEKTVGRMAEGSNISEPSRSSKKPKTTKGGTS